MQSQRPSADDVIVLKKELVQVQTLMDQMTLESEKKNLAVEAEKLTLQSQLQISNNKNETTVVELSLIKVILFSIKNLFSHNQKTKQVYRKYIFVAKDLISD